MPKRRTNSHPRRPYSYERTGRRAGEFAEATHNHNESDIVDLGNYAEVDVNEIITGSWTFEGDPKVESVTPITYYEFSADPGAIQYSGPAWNDYLGTTRWSWRFDNSDLYLYHHNGTPGKVIKFDLGWNRIEFAQRPAWLDSSSTSSHGNPAAGEFVAFSGDPLNFFGDVNYTTTPTEGQILVWDNANGYWEPGDISLGAFSIGDLSDVTITTGTALDVLQFDGAAWVDKSLTEAGIAGLSLANVFTTQQNITATTPYLDFEFGSAPGGIQFAGPRWNSSVGTTKWSFRFDDTDLYFYEHNGTPSISWQMDLAYGRMEFVQRPTAANYGTSAALGAPTGEALFSGDDLDSFADVTYTLAPTTGQTILWNVGGYWEPADVPAAATLGSIGDVTITSIGVNELLQWNGSAWINQTLTEMGIPQLSAANVFTSQQVIHDNTPYLQYKFNGAPGSDQYSGPQWADSTGTLKWSFRYNDTDLKLYHHNGTPGAVVIFDIAYNRVEFVQRPTEDGYGAATLGVPTGEVIFSGDDLDSLADVNYSTTPAEGNLLGWDNANGYWEPVTAIEVTSLIVDDIAGTIEIQSEADAKLILREDGTAQWNRIDFYELTDRHGYLGFGTGNEFLFVNEEASGVMTFQTNSGVITLDSQGGNIVIDDGGTSTGRAASIKTITASATTPTGDYPYGCLHLIY